jgi:hypothetical protein
MRATLRSGTLEAVSQRQESQFAGLEEMREIIIDGVEYVPKATIIPEECLKAFGEIYGLVWTEACYDPYNEQTRKFAKKVWPHVLLINEALKIRK